MAEDSQIRAALTGKSGSCTLWKERRFLLKDDDGATVPGAFDRVEIYHDANGIPREAVILDYKSDKVENSAELIRHHSKQLELYRRCLCRMTGIPDSKIKICLAALRLGEIAEII